MTDNKPALLIENKGIVPKDVEQLWRFASMVFDSGLCPSSIKTPQQAVVAIQMGMEVGLSPMQALNGIAVINGRPSIYGDAGTALVLSSGLLEDREEFTEGEGEDLVSICRLKRKGVKGWFEGRFSYAMARRAGLWGKRGPWTDYPENQCMWRARSFAYRFGFADALKGMAFTEEVHDFNVTNAPSDSGTFRRSTEAVEDVDSIFAAPAEAPAEEEEQTPEEGEQQLLDDKGEPIVF